MLSSKNLVLNKTCQDIFKEMRRCIGKTSSVLNSDAISRQENKLGVNNLELNGTDYRTVSEKWSVHRRHNNIRALSTIQTQAKPSATTSFYSKEDSRDFMAVFPDIVRDLTEAGRHTDIPEVTKRFAKVLQYNVPSGKKSRGLTTVGSYKMFEKPENLTPENIRLANILGWCTELLRAFGEVVDDMIDKSESRRNMLCWYKNDNVGSVAIKDSTLLEQAAYHILREYFSDHPNYVRLIELFHDTVVKSTMGKTLDGQIRNNGAPDLSKMTMKNYTLISNYKNGLHLPVASAMFLANMSHPEHHRQVQTILLEMGQYLQIQQDFRNCFGNPEQIEKIGSDINKGKCSWLAVVALQRANDSQRQIIGRLYGKPDEEAVESIKEVYTQLGLPATYAKYEEQTYKIINSHIQQFTRGLPHKLFYAFLEELVFNVGLFLPLWVIIFSLLTLTLLCGSAVGAILTTSTLYLHGSFLIADDIMDGSQFRRGQLCWYKNEEVGLIAVNDVIALENSLYSILRRHFSELPCYVPILELFHDQTFKTTMGQSLDCFSREDGKVQLDQFTMNRYTSIIKYKTAHYTFHLPIALGMYLANVYDAELHRQAKTIALEIGEFYQIYDDFLDVYGETSVIGKDGTDIKEGKCTWLAVVALQRANSAQRKIMEEHYGVDDSESVKIIKNLFEELGLPATFAVYEQESFNIIKTHIQQSSKGLPHDLFFTILSKFYKRKF